MGSGPALAPPRSGAWPLERWGRGAKLAQCRLAALPRCPSPGRAEAGAGLGAARKRAGRRQERGGTGRGRAEKGRGKGREWGRGRKRKAGGGARNWAWRGGVGKRYGRGRERQGREWAVAGAGKGRDWQREGRGRSRDKGLQEGGAHSSTTEHSAHISQRSFLCLPGEEHVQGGNRAGNGGLQEKEENKEKAA